MNHWGDEITHTAKGSLLTAYDAAVAAAATTTYGPIYDLGSHTLIAGVYNDPSSFGITGTLTLDGAGDPTSVWIFQAYSTLITQPNSVVSLINGAKAANIFWQVGSSATLMTDSTFAGNILAETSITVDPGTTVDGRLLALNGSVTLADNIVSIPLSIEVVPEPNGALLFSSGLATLFALKRQTRDPVSVSNQKTLINRRSARA